MFFLTIYDGIEYIQMVSDKKILIFVLLSCWQFSWLKLAKSELITMSGLTPLVISSEESLKSLT